MIVNKSGSFRLKLLHRFPFSSELKRMSTVVCMDHLRPALSYMSFVKGAPEEIVLRLKHVPSNYHSVYQKYSFKGFRVLALAFKELHNVEIGAWKRADCEEDLEFGGFLVLSSPLKRDSISVIKQLIDSSHKIVMITGDHALTACQVASDLKIVSKMSFISKLVDENADSLSKCVQLVSADESTRLDFV